jgi:N-acetyl-anhydromuramoyl-L-alanine amidase
VDAADPRAAPGVWWPEAWRCPSPNRDARPDGVDPELIVVHAISLPPCEFGGPFIAQLFCNTLDPGAHPYFAEIADLRVSAHVVIGRDGCTTQFVPFDERAWHAGASRWRGRDRCNDFSIGIELEGCDERPFTDAQYATLVRLIRWLRARFPRLADEAAIAGHSDIAPGRKTDPGPRFDWGYLAARLQENPIA